MKLQTHGMTHPGRVRARNEDAFLVDDSRGLYAVADGLGGLPQGDLASKMAIGQLGESVPDGPEAEVNLVGIFEEINRRVYEEGMRRNAEIGIGTTLTVLLRRGTKFHVAHVGDCAAFLVRDGVIRQLTTDHTMEAEILGRLRPGEKVDIPEYFAHTLTRCIGQPGEVEAELLEEEIRPGDQFLLCSDGLTKVLEADEFLTLARMAKSPAAFVEAIIEEANERGGPDNATAVAIWAQS